MVLHQKTKLHSSRSDQNCSIVQQVVIKIIALPFTSSVVNRIEEIRISNWEIAYEISLKGVPILHQSEWFLEKGPHPVGDGKVNVWRPACKKIYPTNQLCLLAVAGESELQTYSAKCPDSHAQGVYSSGFLPVTRTRVNRCPGKKYARMYPLELTGLHESVYMIRVGPVGLYLLAGQSVMATCRGNTVCILYSAVVARSMSKEVEAIYLEILISLVQDKPDI
ncbi:hypothetical protein FQR65_LT19291 [Abscondita terminalis]|nr:hypothetical protein FQR65_LT19291 [Abscondita terminalis]